MVTPEEFIVSHWSVFYSTYLSLIIILSSRFNKALMDCRPNKPLGVHLYGPDLCVRNGNVELIFVMGCVYRVPVTWSLRREKICDCEMVEVKIGTSLYEWRHTCIHRPLVELTPVNGIVSVGLVQSLISTCQWNIQWNYKFQPENPGLLHLRLNYSYEGLNTLCYGLTLPNQRTLLLYIHMYAHLNSKGILTSLRRHKESSDYLAVLDCGKVPINNLDPVIRVSYSRISDSR